MAIFEARPSRGRILLIILGSAIFVLAGLWFIGVFGAVPESRRGSLEMLQIIGWLSIVFFGLCGLYGIKMLFDTDLQVRINATGIYWKRWSDQTILWCDITDVGVWEYQRQKSIILKLRDPARYPSKTVMGKLAGANRALTGGDVTITLSGTDGRFDDAIAVIEHYHNDELGNKNQPDAFLN
jgi:hypothetical protein